MAAYVVDLARGRVVRVVMGAKCSLVAWTCRIFVMLISNLKFS